MSIDWFTFFAQIVNFVVLVALLNHFLYRPISVAIAEREARFANQADSARKEMSAAAALKLKYENLNDQIDTQRQELLDQVNEETAEARKRLMQDARNEVQFRREEWQDSLRREQQLLIKFVAQQSGEQAIAISTRALQQLADKNLETCVLNRFIEHLRELPKSQHKRLQSEFAIANSPAQVQTAFAIPPDWQQKIELALSQLFGIDDVQFVAEPEIILGANLRVGGMKTGFNVQAYIDSLKEQLQRALKQ